MANSSGVVPPVDFASRDHYAVLGVHRTADDAEISRAYKNMAKLYHPDKNIEKRSDAETSFKRIAEAYAVLRDKEKRAEYDRSGGAQTSYVSYEEAERMFQSMGGEDDTVQRGAQMMGEEIEPRKKAIGLILVLATLLVAPQTVIQLLPGLTVAVLGLALLTRRESSSKWAWIALLLLLVGYAAPWAVKLQSQIKAQPLLGGLQQGSDAAAGSPAPVGIPRSGEEVLLGDGKFLRFADPSKRGSGSREADEGWQQRLIGDMTEAIKQGQDQILMVFSRQGCPWCDRQLPVLQRSIERRAANGPGAGAALGAPAFVASQPGLAAVGMPMGGGGMMRYAPLRVFVFDADEFPYLAQAFKVEAFPTSIAWGPPGVTPVVAQGFLDESNLDQLLLQVATSAPGEGVPAGGDGGAAGGQKPKKRGLFR
eukprot:TRINITY_DN34345_c0_g1_i1.p1 TRINITY_DN34345_c0_g1~~TRINITY_DN34345_c0_g1_i1.p1  ORF type:complete len:443 (-),score=77.92 TRINITY_DN34345_c0_g1_i1:81-1349(-)